MDTEKETKADVSATPLTRRGFIRDTALASAVAMGAAATAGTQQQTKPLATALLPKGKIGNADFGRLIFGGNIVSHWMHPRDLPYVNVLARHYNTEQKILDTFELSVSLGIDAIVGDATAMLGHARRFRQERGGRMKVIGWFFFDGDLEKLRRAVPTWAEQGISALLINGCCAEDIMRIHGPEGIALIAKAGDIVRQSKIPFGVGAHDLEIVWACEEHAAVAADFYLKTLHHHRYPTAPRPEQMKEPYAEVPGYWCRDPEAVIRYMQGVKKPWIAFKILAAGAISPSQAFRYAFEGGADFICVGMFDFQVEANCRVAMESLETTPRRKRPWCA
jgi:hypothetical protein